MEKGGKVFSGVSFGNTPRAAGGSNSDFSAAYNAASFLAFERIVAVTTASAASGGGAGAGGVGGTDSSEPEVVPFFHKRRAQFLVCGERHVTVKSGCQMFAWGSNSLGQLGSSSRTCPSFESLANI